MPSSTMPCWWLHIQQKGRKSMLKPFITYVGTINDIQDRRGLMLITDSFEVKHILDYLGYPAPDDDDPMDFSGLFVLVGGGDYEEIYAFEGSVPYLYKDLWMIKTRWITEK
jgi:hypothetical protein